MVSRLAILLAGVLLLGGASLPAAAQTITYYVTPPYPNISLGFDQSSLTPASQGTPLYTQGDDLWIVSHYSHNVVATFIPPINGFLGAYATLNPGQPVDLYTFSSGDPSGTWSLDLTNTTGVFIASFSVTVASPSGGGIAYQGSSLSPGFLSTSLAVFANGAYNLQGCLLGSRIIGVPLTIPQGYGTGFVVLNLTAINKVNSAIFSNYTSGVRGALFNPTDFWFELYQSYSFAAPGSNGSGLFSRLVQVATSSRQILGQSAGANQSSGSVFYQAGPRMGRYTLRGYFRSTQGIQVVESPLLLQRDYGWLSLANCVATSQPAGLTFSLKTPLQTATIAWPRTAVIMFRQGGLEDYGLTKVDPGLSAVTLVGAHWNQTLTNVDASVTGPGVRGSETINGTVYVLAQPYPLNATFGLSFGSSHETLQTQLPASYSKQDLAVQVGRLVVQTTTNGSPTPGVRVTLLAGSNASLSEAGDSGGRTTFYTLPGNFTVSGGGASSSVRVLAGTETDVTLDLGGQQAGTIIWALAGIGVVGLAANGYVWWRWWRSRKSLGGA